MQKVAFILVPSFSKSNWLNEKMMQITEAFISILNIEKYPVIYINNYNDINKHLNAAELLVVATAGTVIIDRDHIWDKIHNIPNNIGLMGNLLQHGDETPWMHEQFFIINTKAFNTLDFSQGNIIGNELIRSEEDMHGGWAPLSISLGESKIARQDKFGTKLIDHCLSNGYKISNWDHEWRYNDHQYLLGERLPARGFCYPTRNTSNFEYALKNLVLIPDLDEAQTMLISAIIKVQEFNVLNAYHYEEVKVLGNADTVIAPATGFLAEDLAIKSNAKRIIFYDKNPNNIEFKRKLYNEWDGNNYNQLVLDYAKAKNLSIEPTSEYDLIQSKKYLLEFKDWNNFKQSKEVDFLVCDCVTNTDSLLSFIDGKTIIHTSTILTIYPFSAIMYSKEQIYSAREKIKNADISWLEV